MQCRHWLHSSIAIFQVEHFIYICLEWIKKSYVFDPWHRYMTQLLIPRLRAFYNVMPWFCPAISYGLETTWICLGLIVYNHNFRTHCVAWSLTKTCFPKVHLDVWNCANTINVAVSWTLISTSVLWWMRMYWKEQIQTESPNWQWWPLRCLSRRISSWWTISLNCGRWKKPFFAVSLSCPHQNVRSWDGTSVNDARNPYLLISMVLS